MSADAAACNRSPASALPNSFAYLFERFPSFVQTFVHREAMEMVRQGMEPWLVSIRQPDDAGDVPGQLEADVCYLPEPERLRAAIDELIAEGLVSGRVRRAVARWRKLPDSNRVFEAAWLGPRLRERGIRHIHAHFGGLAARTAWMLKELFGFTYSFTGHANDIFCENDFPVTNAMLVRGAKLIVTETDFARRWMAKKHWPRGRRIVRVYNGLPTTGFGAREPVETVTRILSVGRSVEKKGFPDLIEACRILHERGRTFSCEIVGGGPLDAALRAQIAQANLGKIVRLPGPRSQAEVRKLLAHAHLFVLASIPEAGGGSDNFPTVIGEAMLTGQPVVSTRVAGIPEMVFDGENGFLVPPQEPPALAAAIERLLDDSLFATRLGLRGREIAVARFAIETTTRELKRSLVDRCGVPVPPKARELDPTLVRGRWAGFLGRTREEE